MCPGLGLNALTGFCDREHRRGTYGIQVGAKLLSRSCRTQRTLVALPREIFGTTKGEHGGWSASELRN